MRTIPRVVDPHGERPNLTDRQAEILSHIESCVTEQGLPPTRAEVSKHFGFSSANAAETHLRALAKKGYIEITAGASRGIKLMAQSVGLPVIGRVAAGSPIMAIEHVESHCPLPAQFFSPKADYLLKVKGMSMRDAGIFDGDLIAVHKTDSVRSGDIIIARIDDEVTVKTLERKSGAVRLLPANPDFQPIEVSTNDESFTIEGKCVGVIRR
jgi:repressor LexA